MSETIKDGHETVVSPEINLDFSDVIDREIYLFRQELYGETSINLSDQQKIIDGVQKSNKAAQSALIQTHKGIVAIVGYAYKSDDNPSQEIMLTGCKALLLAARTYGGEQTSHFPDYAVDVMHLVLEKEYGSVEGSPHKIEGDDSMGNIYKFLDRIVDDNLESRYETYKYFHDASLPELKDITPAARKILPLLHLKQAEILEKSGVSRGQLDTALGTIKKKLGQKDIVQLALDLRERGLEFKDLREGLPKSDVSLNERLIASSLQKNNPAIARDLGMTREDVDHAIKSLLFRCRARSRAELALIAANNGYQPTEAEILEDIPGVLRDFTALQQKIITKLHLYEDSLPQNASISQEDFEKQLKEIKDKMDLDSITALAVEFMRRGVEYDAREPRKPLDRILDEQATQVVRLLTMSDKEIAEGLNLDVDAVKNIIRSAIFKTGARSRTELALMQIKADKEEAVSPIRNIMWAKFLGRLGLQQISQADLEEAKGQLSDLEWEFVEKHYISVDRLDINWAEIGEKHGLDAKKSGQIGIQGLNKLRAIIKKKGLGVPKTYS